MIKTSPQRRILLEQLDQNTANSISTGANKAYAALYAFDSVVAELAGYNKYELRDELRSVMVSLQHFAKNPSIILTGAEGPKQQPTPRPPSTRGQPAPRKPLQ